MCDKTHYNKKKKEREKKKTENDSPIYFQSYLVF